MKKRLNKKTLWQSLLSVLTLSFFILLALGSFEGLFPESQTKYIGNGIYQEKIGFMNSGVMLSNKIITGKHDSEGRWNGKVTTQWFGNGEYTEEAYMAYGMRQGICTRKYLDGRTVEEYYVNDIRVDPPTKSGNMGKNDVSAYMILENKYPWYLFSLNAIGFDNDYVKTYMDTVENMLVSQEFNSNEFDDFLGNALDSLGETRFDTLTTLNSNLAFFKRREDMKNAEFRLAIIDRYRSVGNSTFGIINTTFPRYLKAMNDSGIVNQDFELFCNVMDSCMSSYGTLDLADPFFIDSVDTRIFRAIYFVLSTGQSSSLATKLSVRSATLLCKKHDFNNVFWEFRSIFKPSLLTSTPYEVGAIVLNDMLMKHYIEGDILRLTFLEAFNLKRAIILPPISATSFEGNNSATSVNLQGYVLEDGGSAVTSRGICWATFYNPTNLDNPISSETGIGKFNITLNGLNKGTTYYARTFATNSSGTAYGNCVKFIAGDISEIDKIKIDSPNFTIFPNPASALTTFYFKLESSENQVLSIADMNGKIVFQKNLGSLSQGVNQVTLNLSNFPNGLYNCQLMGGKVKSICKLAITH